MSESTVELKAFARRVRLLRSWRGLALGACYGGALATVWAVLDWANVLYAEWWQLGALVGVSALLGAVIGLFQRLSPASLTTSIDRRAGLEDRLATAFERQDEHDAFDEAQRADAARRFDRIKPSSIFPIRVGRTQYGAIALATLAASLFLLGNTPFLLGEDAKKDRAELQREGKRVERVTKENFETPEARANMSEEERRLAAEMRKYEKQLEKARISKEDALQKANELAKKADDLMRKSAKDSQQNLDKAESALKQLQKAELDKAGIQNVPPEMAEMSDAERSDQLKQNAQQQQNLKSQLDALAQKIQALKDKLKNSNLSEAERKKAEEELRKLQNSQSDAEKSLSNAKAQAQQLRLSEEAQKVLQQMMNTPEWKQLQEMAAKLRKNAEQTQQKGQPPLSKEELKKLQKQMEELLKSLKDPAAMKEYLKALMEAMKNAGQCDRAAGLVGLAGIGFGNQGSADGQSQMTNEEDVMSVNTGTVNKNENGKAGLGKTTMSMSPTVRKEGAGRETYVEIKAPTKIGTRTSVPYVKVLPSYRKKAESALERQQIPKQYEKRVKEYFEGLGAG